MARRHERRRLRRVLPFLGRNFVLIRVSVPNDPFWGRQSRDLRDVLLAAGAVEVVYGGFSQAILEEILTDEIQAGHLPQDAWELAAAMEGINVFCHLCIEDVRFVIQRIEDGIPDCQPLQVDQLFIDYKGFRKDILCLGMLDFECSSPRHPRHVEVDAADSSDDAKVKKTELSVALRGLELAIGDHYMLNTDDTDLSETTFQGLNCAFYRLLVNKDFLLVHSSKEDLNDSSHFLGGLLKLLGGLMSVLKSHLSQPEDGFDAAVLQNLCSFQQKVDILLMGLTEIDLDDSFRMFIANTGIDWAAMLEFIVLSSLELQTSLQDSVSGLISGERAGISQDRKLLKDSIDILKASSLYDTIVEVPYLRSAPAYYSSLSKRLIRTLDIGEYVKKAEMLMDREVHFVRQFMDPRVESEIISLIAKEMIADHKQRLVVAIDSHLSQLIVDGSYDDISRLFMLVLKIPNGKALFYEALTAYIRTTLGVLIANTDKEPVEYVQLILDERFKYERIIKQHGCRDMRVASQFSLALRKISAENLHLPQYLSLFLDRILAQERVDLHVFGGALHKAMALVADFDDKSVFQIYYQLHLADRLLCGTYSEEVELEVLSKLQLYCCPHYVDKLRTMIDDIRSSKLLMRSFCDNNLLPRDAIPISVRVLRSHFWPKQPLVNCKLPVEMMQSLEVFHDFYLQQYRKRKMAWSVSMGSTVVTARFGDEEEYELCLPLHHLCILVLFNSESSLTFEEIQQKTCIPHAHLKKCLSALTGVGQNLLHKETGGQITCKDRFFLNEQFSSKFNKLTFASLVNFKDVRITIDEDGTSAIDSVIVKILKEKSAGLSFNGLVKGLKIFLKSKFSITPRAVQRRLYTLMSWEVVKKEVLDGKVYYKYYLNLEESRS